MIDEIIILLREITGFEGTITEEASIQDDLEVYGDDMDEFLTAYSEKFKVNMDSYLWYFHTSGEGWNIGSIFFKPPNKRVEQITITPSMLTKFAESGVWDIDYPNHSIPKRRYDIIINQVIVIIIVFGWIGWLLISKYLIK